MEFPHLSDTNFPLLNNVNVYSYRNEFDYTRWISNTRVTLTNVLWNSDYNDVVKFDNDSARDEWFDEQQDSYKTILLANHTLPPEGGIKLPIPYDVASRYNYLFVDIPVMTSSNQPIEYENVEFGMRRWYFFIDEVSSRAPNTTMFLLSLDVWTQFHNDVEINYLFLERGHAPVAATDTDTFLANPIHNNDYLLTPDVTPTGSQIVRDSDFIPFCSGTKYLCIASTLAPSGFSSLGYVTHNSPDFTYQGTLSFSDIPNLREGYQLHVDAIGIGDGDSYSTLNRLISNEVSDSATNGRTPGNVNVYAIRTDYVFGSGTLFNDIITTVPHFMNTVQGCFVVDETMINLTGTTVTLAGHTLYLVNGKSTDVQLPSLTKSQFGYPQKYQRFAKLYTYPYASIELTDNEGETVTVRIENTGDIVAHKVTNIAFPCLRTKMFFSGINGVGSDTYTWKYLNNQSVTKYMPKSDWFDYCFDHEIPCYAIYMDGRTAWYLDNFNNKLRGKARDVISAYQQAVRPANTQYENDLDYDATEYVNAQNTNNTNYSNADADATTLVNNTARTTATQTATTNATVATNSDKTIYANNLAEHITNLTNAKATDTTSESNYASSITLSAQNESTATVARNNSNASIHASSDIAAGGAMTVAAGAAIGTVAAPGVGTLVGAGVGAVASGLTGLINAQYNASAAEANASSVIQASTTAVDANNNANTAIKNIVNQYNSSVTLDNNDAATYNNNKNNALLIGNTQRSNDNMTQNNGATANTLRANANRSKNTGITNAENLKNVRDSNSFYMNHDIRIKNAKQQAETSRFDSQYDVWQSGLEPPRQYGAYAGDSMLDFMGASGVQMKIKTMSDSEVRQVGDWFSRYGYALEQIWDVSESGLCPMRHFCYWKARDVWVDDLRSSNNNALRVISNVFVRGVTIWKDPEEIGRVNVYDN